MKTRLTLILLFSSKLIFGQQDSIDNKLRLTLTPLSLIDFYSGSSPRIGIEYKLKNNYAFYHEIGTYFPNFNGIKNNQGILAKTEFKYYLKKSGFTSDTYFSAELFYKYQTYNTWDTINIKPIYRKDYTVYKSVGCFTIKYGLVEFFKCGITLDYFVGLGVRFKNAHSTLTTEENNNIQRVGDNGGNILENKAGQFILPNFEAGFKIGYKLK